MRLVEHRAERVNVLHPTTESGWVQSVIVEILVQSLGVVESGGELR